MRWRLDLERHATGELGRSSLCVVDAIDRHAGQRRRFAEAEISRVIADDDDRRRALAPSTGRADARDRPPHRVAFDRDDPHTAPRASAIPIANNVPWTASNW